MSDDYPEIPPLGYFDVNTNFKLTSFSYNQQKEEFMAPFLYHLFNLSF